MQIFICLSVSRAHNINLSLLGHSQASPRSVFRSISGQFKVSLRYLFLLRWTDGAKITSS